MTGNQSIILTEEVQEEWRSVVGYEGVYEISGLGRVRRIKRACGTQTGRILKAAIMWCGYLQLTLCSNGQRENHRVAGLVAAAFLGPRPHQHQVNHKDGNKLNNRSINLEYVTQSQNIQHAVVLGLYGDRRGSNNNLAKLTETTVMVIKKRLARGEASNSIAKDLEIPISRVKDIKRGAAWKHLTCN